MTEGDYHPDSTARSRKRFVENVSHPQFLAQNS